MPPDPPRQPRGRRLLPGHIPGPGAAGTGNPAGASRWDRGCTGSRGAWHCGRGRPTRCASEREARAAIDPATAVAEPEPDADDLGQALHAEIDRLPEKYRAPVVLCYLQGRTIDEASRLLGWPVGTVGGRLARARDRLRDGLVRRGVIAPAALVATLARTTGLRGGRAAGAGRVPPTTLRCSSRAGRAATAVVSATVAKLLEETLRTMAWTRLMIGAGICGLLGALAIGAAGMSLTQRCPR